MRQTWNQTEICVASVLLYFECYSLHFIIFFSPFHHEKGLNLITPGKRDTKCFVKRQRVSKAGDVTLGIWHGCGEVHHNQVTASSVDIWRQMTMASVTLFAAVQLGLHGWLPPLQSDCRWTSIQWYRDDHNANCYYTIKVLWLSVKYTC